MELVTINVVKTSRDLAKRMTGTGLSSGQFWQMTCSRCRRSPIHDASTCPARDTICRKCGKREHFQPVCRSKRVSAIKEYDQLDHSFYLGMVSEQEPWSVALRLNGQSFIFCIETGAEVTVIPENIYTKIGSPKLEPIVKALKAPSDHRLACKGNYKGYFQRGDITTEGKFYVIDNLHKPLLGRPAITAMKLLSRIGLIEEQTINN